ncbi:MAG: site-specific integrase [Oscillibacter sp.]|uniref:tyrosine-type recombinase/integrase n=1 Tax=Oscillibacter sp. TaxID=1945593 RepID=UPI0021722B15|nr:site-specific integrase [Oscillibacter sp.]MCI8841511.1 site-specific integrase [Oscillibacter sp.]MCI9113811.1 site-specific integrase [Oscillibacter sp.]
MSNHYRNLMSQVDKLHRHNRQGSYKTRARYYEAMQRFCRFLAEVYRLERLANIAPKHIYAYVAYLQEQGKSTSTIKTDLSAIRFFHDLIPSARYELPGNGDLCLQRRTFGGVDRTWSAGEFERMLGIALERGREDYVSIFYLGRFAGLRIHECFRIDTATAAKAVKEKAITIKGKGGLVRAVPLNDLLVQRLQQDLKRTPRGHKLYVSDDQETHEAIKALQAFIWLNRSTVQDEGSTRPMTFHGLRHTYAAEKYRGFIDAGVTPFGARKAVSKLLGHGRDDVTNIYLASLKEGKENG